AVVAVPGAVLVRGEEPLRDEDRLAAAERAEAVEIVARDPAVGAVDVVIGGDGVDPGRHGAHRRRVVVDGEPVAEEERVGIGGTERVVGEMVVALGDDAGPAADDLDAAATGPTTGRRPLVPQEVREGGDTGRR